MIPCYVPGVDGLGFWFTGCIDCSDNDIRMIYDNGNDDDDDYLTKDELKDYLYFVYCNDSGRDSDTDSYSDSDSDSD